MFIIEILVLLYLIIGTLIIYWAASKGFTKEEHNKILVVTWIYSIITWLPMLIKILINIKEDK